ncbi:succinate receptor 1-like, partial [Aplochiton taeniatus]
YPSTPPFTSSLCPQVLNCTQLSHVLELYYLSPFYALEFCVGFPSNLVVVLGYIFLLPEWRSINIYLFNLALSDLTFLCTLPRLSYLYANGKLERHPYACIINRYILHVNLYSSILFMAWVSLDRFLVVKHPSRQHFLLSRPAALLMTALSWLAVNVQVAPLVLLMVQDLQRGNWSFCKDFASLRADSNLLPYSLTLTLTGYVLPLLGIGLASVHLRRLLRAQQEAIRGRTTSFRRPLRMVKVAAIMFLVLYTPYHFMRNVRIVSREARPALALCPMMYIRGLYILTRPLAFLHSVINPVFYFLIGDQFRELLLAKLRELARRIRTYCSSVHVLSARTSDATQSCSLNHPT